MININTVVIAINSKYVHSSLAIRYLTGYCYSRGLKTKPLEFNINQNVEKVAFDILAEEPDIVAISVYIWNIDFVCELCSILKLAKGEVTLILGGPEVTYDSEEFLARNPFADIVIRGEGEETLADVLEALGSGKPLNGINGITYRSHSGIEIVTNSDRSPIELLDSLPPAYNPSGTEVNSIDNLKGRIAYYETSRGCPFRCQYCLSSITPGVRYFSLDRIKSELPLLIKSGTSTIKFVDRTFNSDRTRARSIWQYIMALSPQSPPYPVVFHFEIAGDLLGDEDIELLSHVPPGLFQFEIGVQSTNPETLDIIHRRTILKNLERAVTSLVRMKNIIINMDLIAGLPGDTYGSFEDAIDYVLNMRPTNVHLGFLKLLRGSGLRKSAEELGLRYRPDAPYEIIRTETLDFADLIRFKQIEDILDRYYNSGKYKNTFYYCFETWSSPSSFLKDFAEFWQENGYFELGQSPSRYGAILQEFIDASAISKGPDISTFLQYDTILADKPSSGGIRFSEEIFDYIRTNCLQYASLDAREMSRRLYIAAFPFDIEAAVQTEDQNAKQNIIQWRTNTVVAFIYGRRDINNRVEKEIKLEGVL